MAGYCFAAEFVWRNSKFSSATRSQLSRKALLDGLMLSIAVNHRMTAGGIQRGIADWKPFKSWGRRGATTKDWTRWCRKSSLKFFCWRSHPRPANWLWWSQQEEIDLIYLSRADWTADSSTSLCRNTQRIEQAWSACSRKWLGYRYVSGIGSAARASAEAWCRCSATFNSPVAEKL